VAWVKNPDLPNTLAYSQVHQHSVTIIHGFSKKRASGFNNSDVRCMNPQLWRSLAPIGDRQVAGAGPTGGTSIAIPREASVSQARDGKV